MPSSEVPDSQLHPERRGSRRIPIRLDVIYQRIGFHEAQAVDVCDGGLSLLAAEPLRSGDALDLYLHQRSLHVSGVVVHEVPLERGHHRVGVRFAKPDPALAGAILAFAQPGAT
jgi:PilZ domain